MNIHNELHRGIVFDNERVNLDVMRFILSQCLLLQDVTQLWCYKNRVPGNGFANIEIDTFSGLYKRFNSKRNLVLNTITFNNFKCVLSKLGDNIKFKHLCSTSGNEFLHVNSFKIMITNLEGFLDIMRQQRLKIVSLKRMRGTV